MVDKNALEELQNMVFSVAGKLSFMSMMAQHTASAMSAGDGAIEDAEKMILTIASEMRDGAEAFEETASAIYRVRKVDEEDAKPTEN